MKFEIFWKLKGATGNHKSFYKGSDIIEFEKKPTKQEVEDILDDIVINTFNEYYSKFVNFQDAHCRDSVIENFSVVKIKEFVSQGLGEKNVRR